MQGRSRHIPYRDSRLTYLLQDSLGGNAKTCLVGALACWGTQLMLHRASATSLRPGWICCCLSCSAHARAWRW